MARMVVRVYIPKEMKPYLEFLVDQTGLSESEILRTSLMEFYHKYFRTLTSTPKLIKRT